MIEVGAIIALCLFSAAVGMLFSETVLERNREAAKMKSAEENAEALPPGEENEETLPPCVPQRSPSPVRGGNDEMRLRNGMGVTRDRNPSFAEQWVNIMNYNGESQLEGDYEETDDPAGDLG